MTQVKIHQTVSNIRSFQYNRVFIQRIPVDSGATAILVRSTDAKPCRMQISRNRKACNSGQGKVVKHVTRPNYLPAGPCVYRNFVPHPPPPSICLCQCIVWDPLASRKLMLALEMKSEKQLYRLILFTVELVCSRWRKMENAPLYFVVTHSHLYNKFRIRNVKLLYCFNSYMSDILYIYIIHAIYIMYYEAKLQQAWENF